MLIERGITLLLAIGIAAGTSAQVKTPADYVNPFIGASTSMAKAGSHHGLGKTFPGAATPFGLVQLSPNTITGGDNGSGYSYEHEYIEGFAFTQMSGVGWYGDLGNFLVTPTTGALQMVAGRHPRLGKGYRSHYDKGTETAQAGYYAATLTDYKVRAEATAMPRSGMLRFTFPQQAQSRIQIDLARRVGGTSTEQYIQVVDKYTIRGWMKCTPDGGGWGNGSGKADYTVYFYAQFSKPLVNYGAWRANIPVGQSRRLGDIEQEHYDSLILGSVLIKNFKEVQGKHLGFYTEFGTKTNEVVLMKAGISFVSMDGAALNLKTDIAHWDFTKIKQAAKQLWNKELSKMQVTGGTEDEKTVFYTALYHSLIDPRNVADTDGKYRGGDGNIHTVSHFIRRSVFSGWDVFRSEMPLQTIINPALVNDVINSLVTLAAETGKGYLERWELLNAYSGCMLGNPAVVVITDAYNKGIRNFDINNAYTFSRNSVEKFGNGTLGYSTDISRTLEHAYSEWCMAQLADSLHQPDDAQLYGKRAKSYVNTFDKEKGWFRPRNADGTWREWPQQGRLQQDYGTTESNPYQQGWFVPHDVPGMVELMGGREKVLVDLTSFFENTPSGFLWNNYYNHVNEPVHHVPFLFNQLGKPWLTQKWSRIICEKAYRNGVEGLVGNDDVGQMSAWYVLAASGIHPVCPGNPRYEITSPVFDKVVMNSGKTPYTPGKPFSIIAINNAPDHPYIQSAKLNGKPYNKCWLLHRDIINGGTLELVMGNEPNEQWGRD